MALSNFRRSATTDTKRKGGGKGFRGNWRDKLYLEQDVPTAFLFQTFEYVDPAPSQNLIEIGPDGQPKPVVHEYYKFRTHRRKVPGYGGKDRFLDETCSAGWNPHNPQPCVGCYCQDAGQPEFGKKTGDSFAAGIIHLVPYHRIPLVDPQKGPIMKSDNSGPVLVDEECEGKSCNFCRVLQGQAPIIQQNRFWSNPLREQIQTVFGARRYLQFGPNHLKDLALWDMNIGERCSGPAYAKDAQGNFLRDAHGQVIPSVGKCGEQLSVDGYACQDCGTVLIDVSTDPRELKELERIAISEKYPCHKCQKPVLLKELNSCDVCGTPTIATVFGSNTVLFGMKQGEQKDSHLVLKDHMTLAAFEAGLDPINRGLLQGKTLAQRVEELNQPIDFEELYKPKDLAAQCKRYQLNAGPNGMPILQNQAPTNYMPQQPQWGGPAAQQGGYPTQAPQPGGYPAPGPQYQQPQYPQGQSAPQQGYQTYGPGPAPFQAPPKPNFGQ
jgi:hypothetical protein